MNQGKKILVVEDEEKILSVVKSFLESKGFLVVPAMDGKKALELFDREDISMVLLDLMLPELSGEEVCLELRKRSRVPIIMLTAKSDEADMLTGLGIGADDYITKPFSLKALHARMEAVMRRSGDDVLSVTRKAYRDGDLTVDFGNHTILKQSEEVKLTPNEFKLLATLARYPNKVFTRDELITSALGMGFEGFDRTIDSHIKNLRQKIETDPRNPVYVKTIHGVGYKFGGE
ncbi:MAG TPA: response regulator transcription factor [Clostridiales bacterium]|nr:response regulator transcription factor [Clostridiales bacterium]